MKLKLPFYVISDTHWLHDNIVKYCGRPEDHNDRMVKNWNSVVGPDDVVLHLGDLAYGVRDYDTGGQDQEKTKWMLNPYISVLNGHKYLIKGNHDNFPDSWYEDLGFTIVDSYFSVRYRKQRVTFTHVPVVLTYKNEINCHGHVHNTSFSGLTKRHLNMSVEVIDYTPKLITKALDYKIDYQL
jgi:calcineurin-like phosphoesterase family protein